MAKQARKITFSIDGTEVEGWPGQTIVEAADEAGVYIPRLCHKPGLQPFGSCRVCTVKANGRLCSSCTQPIAPGMVVLNEDEEINDLRRSLVEMMFVEGNHFCMFCEKSGNCELQAVAYRLGIRGSDYEYFFREREIDASHPDVFIDHNRCIRCARCVRTSRDVDGKHVFQFVGRGTHKRIAVNSAEGLGGTEASGADEAIAACPTGALMRKRVGYAVPIGKRLYDHEPIGTDIEARGATKAEG